MGDNLTYYSRRAKEELAAAARSTDASIALIHRELAGRYCQLLIWEELDGRARPKQASPMQVAEADALLV